MAINDDVFTTGTQSPAISAENILKKIHDIKMELQKVTEQENETNKKIFKNLFDADLTRGDLVVFPLKRLSTYNLFIEKLPQQIVKQIKIDRAGMIQEPIVLNGGYIDQQLLQVNYV
jgi:hypothetical protein